MRRTYAESHEYWENRVKRAWEALRRNEEFHADCLCVGDSSLSDEQVATRFKRFTEKWGIECNNPDSTYEEIKGSVTSWRTLEARIHGEALAREIYPNIPQCFVFLLSRLQGYSGPRDLVVQCQEQNEMDETLQANTQGRWNRMPASKRVEHLGNWAPPDRVHLTVDLEADPFEVANRVLNILPVLHDVRVRRGLTEPYGQQVKRKLNSRPTVIGDPYDAGKRFDFGQDDDVFRVWDLKQAGKTDMEIARMLWPVEFKRGKARDTKTGDKGALAQMVHDYYRRARNWIREYPPRVKHAMLIL